jgi:CRISPR system Cascade subunit CasA
VPNLQGDSQAAAVLDHAINLHRVNSGDAVYQPLLVAGLASDQAKLLRWRAEQVVLPASVLLDADKASSLRQLVGAAEELFGDLRRLASRMLAETLPDPGSKDTRARASEQLKAGSLATSFFAAAERALPRIMQLIDANRADEAVDVWNGALRKGALKSWEQVLTGLGHSPNALRADARFWPRLHGLLNKYVPKTESSTAEDV